jgi:hypothetical protein
MNLTVSEFKSLARSLQRAQKGKLSSSLGYSQCLDVIAQAQGFSTYRAWLAAQTLPVSAHPTAPTPPVGWIQVSEGRVQLGDMLENVISPTQSNYAAATPAQVDTHVIDYHAVFRAPQAATAPDLAYPTFTLMDRSGPFDATNTLVLWSHQATAEKGELPLIYFIHRTHNLSEWDITSSLVAWLTSHFPKEHQHHLTKHYLSLGFKPQLFAGVQLQTTLANDSIVDKEPFLRYADVTYDVLSLSISDLHALQDNDETSDALVSTSIDTWGHTDCFACRIESALSDWLAVFGFSPDTLTPAQWASVRNHYNLTNDMEWEVNWSKTYIATGTVRVTASSPKDAERQVLDRIGDLEGSMQYLGDEDTAEAHPV